MPAETPAASASSRIRSRSLLSASLALLVARAGDMVVESGSERLLGTPVRLSRTPADPTRAAGPPRGAQTDAVLTEAGLTADEIGALRDAGAVA